MKGQGNDVWKKLQAGAEITAGLVLFAGVVGLITVSALGIFVWRGTCFTWNKVIQMGSR